MDRNEGGDNAAVRTAADLASLLLELSRALKGLRYYEDAHPARRAGLDRAYLALRAELDRSGPLEVRHDATGFAATGTAERVPTTHLHELAEALDEHALEALRFTPELTRRSFQTALEGLAEEERRLVGRGGLAGVVAGDAAPGVELSGVAAAQPAPGDDPNETTQPMEASPLGLSTAELTAQLALDADLDLDLDGTATDTPLEEVEPDLDALSGHAVAESGQDAGPAASLGSALLDSVKLRLDEIALPGPDDPVRLAPAPASRAEAAAASPGPDATVPLPSGFEDFTKPSLEEDPLAAPSSSDSDEALRERLCRLDHCSDDEAYAELATDTAGQAAGLSDDGYRDAAYRAVLVFADHAAGGGGRSGHQALAAQECLENLCRNALLSTVIDRACDPEGSVAVRAAQVLLQLGGRAASPLFERLAGEVDEARAAQLRSILIAMGERSAPIVVAAMRGDDPRRARVAVRLAGELQSTHLVPTLLALVDGAAPELRRDALRALARIGGPKAVEAVEAALSSDRPGVSATAAACLGEMQRRASARPLMERLDLAVAAGESELARSIVGALGALGAEEAAPKLVSLLERRVLWNRALARALRVPAFEALAKLPGREAARAVERAARHRDARVRRAAARLSKTEPTG
ncbi:MAG: HEAT repeat domain-containing protein [Myxococcota bacterium]